MFGARTNSDLVPPIPKVASKHGVVLTQDRNIHRTRAQWELCQQNKLGVFFFRAPKRKVGVILFNRRCKDLAAGTGCHSKDATEIKRVGSFPKYPWPRGA